jgi:signal peptidase
VIGGFQGVEIAPVPHRTTRGERKRLGLGLLVLAPVVLLVVLPAVLGLDRYVVTDRAMEGSLSRGSVVLAREVAPTDLRAGDVITFPRPGGDPRDHVVRRIVAVHDGVATTRSDRSDEPDPWALSLSDTASARVTVGVPWLGYPFVVDGGWIWLVLAAAAALVLALVAGRGTTLKVGRPARARLPVA